jgi:hypothetical protein
MKYEWGCALVCVGWAQRSCGAGVLPRATAERGEVRLGGPSGGFGDLSVMGCGWVRTPATAGVEDSGLWTLAIAENGVPSMQTGTSGLRGAASRSLLALGAWSVGWYAGAVAA